MRMRHIVTCGLSGSALFSTLSQKRNDFRKKLLNIIFVLILLATLSETFLILRRNERDVIINVYRSACEVPLLSSDLNEARVFLTDFRQILKYKCILCVWFRAS